MLYRHDCIYVLYMDDTLLFGVDKLITNKVIKDPRNKDLDLTVKGDIKDFLGVHVEETNGIYTITQPLLTVQILTELRITYKSTASKSPPMNKLLRPGKGRPKFYKHCN